MWLTATLHPVQAPLTWAILQQLMLSDCCRRICGRQSKAAAAMCSMLLTPNAINVRHHGQFQGQTCDA